MEPSSTGSVALITGGARRIGAHIARTLHDAGWRIVVHCRSSRDDAETLVAELNAARADSARIVQADFREAGAPTQAVQAAAHCWGRLDALVNNASSYLKTPLQTVSADTVEDLLASNLKAPLEAIQAFARQEGASAVVNIIDTLARHVRSGYAPYYAAKSGLWTLTEALALELAPTVRVNGVAPGHILWATNTALGEVERQDEVARIPLQRLGKGEDIACAVRFLLSSDAAYVTGAILPVDGGLRLG